MYHTTAKILVITPSLPCDLKKKLTLYSHHDRLGNADIKLSLKYYSNLKQRYFLLLMSDYVLMVIWGFLYLCPLRAPCEKAATI